MATPETEETVAAPATAEEVVKSAEGGEKEAPKAAAAKEPTEVEKSAKKTEEAPTTDTPAEAAEDTTETTETPPAEEPTVPFKEESNLVSDLKESEKKALEEFRARIVKAIEDKEFKVPKKVVEAPKEPELVQVVTEAPAPLPGTTPDPETVETKTLPAETPAAETPATQTPAVETPPATETPVEKKSAEEKPAEEKSSEEKSSGEKSAAAAPPAAETPAAEKPELKSKEAVAPPAEPAAEPKPADAPETPASAEKTPAAENKTKEEVSPAEAAATATPVEEAPSAVEEEPEDPTPPEDVSLWGVPLLHTKGDKRTDVILLKFLRAREFNVSQAFEQLKKTIIWRKTFKADGLLEEDFGTDLDEVAFYYGEDKEGHPICYNVYAPFHNNSELYAKAFGDSAKLASFIRWRIRVLEKGLKLLNFSPEGPNAMVQISDVKFFPIATGGKAKSAYSQAVNILQDNYPELVVKQVFINAPWYFRPLYIFLKMNPFTSARSKSKFSIYAPGRTTEALLKFIPGESLPVAYGGLSKPNDPDFAGIKAPATEQVIKASDKATIEIPVSETGGTVVWDLTVAGYEVTYGAEYVPSAEGGYTTIIEKPRKLPSTTEEPVRNSFKISEPGKIVITIDNAVRKKKIAIYRYTVKNPNAELGKAG